MLVKIISTGAMILGLYIIASFLFLQSTKYSFFEFGPGPTYHIGCYNTQSSLNHSEGLRSKIMQLQETLELETKLHPDLIEDSKAMKPTFDRDVKEVARDFQKYLDNFNHYKIQGENDLHYYKSLANTRRAFEECRRENLENFNQVDCLNTWEKYKSTSNGFFQLKELLKKKIKEKEVYEKKIEAYLFGKGPDDNEQIEIHFDWKIKGLNKKQIEIQNKIFSAKTKQVKISGRWSTIQTDMESLKTLLKQCEDNAKIIVYCEGVNKDIKGIRSSITEKKLEESLDRKRKIIQMELKALRNAKKIGDNRKIMISEVQVNKTIDQMRSLEQQIALFHSYQDDVCSQQCSSDRIKELRKNILELESERHTLKQQQVQITNSLITFQTQIRRLQQSRKQAEEQFQKLRIMGAYTGCQDQKCMTEQMKGIVTYRTELNKLLSDISTLQLQFNNKRQQNAQRINQLGRFIKRIYEVQECLEKKYFYEQLKEMSPKKSDIGEKKIQSAKRVLIKELKDFEL